MLVELHDLIPYLFSISIFASFAYAAYFFHRQGEEGALWLSETGHCRVLSAPRRVAGMHGSLGLALIRCVKRKESPDGDSADCRSLSRRNSISDREDEYDKRYVKETIIQTTEAVRGSRRLASVKRVRYERNDNRRYAGIF
ncbi:hypothetical protein ACFSL6_03685 [Paenibacillus thailandensis]|uniref:Uncharacterized protein n=1 Tax=Paenibacillus thailandensis TaxID=393250 RepID=A0ABW5R4V5_9BACL